MKTPMLDIASIVPMEREIQIEHPNGTGEKLPIWVTVMSVDDPRLQPHTKKLQEKNQERARRGKVIPIDEREKAIIDLLARTITGWRWEVHYKGEFPAFSHLKAVEILSDENIIWFRKQIDDAVGDANRFFQS